MQKLLCLVIDVRRATAKKKKKYNSLGQLREVSMAARSRLGKTQDTSRLSAEMDRVRMLLPKRRQRPVGGR